MDPEREAQTGCEGLPSINTCPIPRSLLVVEKDMLEKPQMALLYFEGGAAPQAVAGHGLCQSGLCLSADKLCDDALACDFPAHAANGHWLAFHVNDRAKVPSLKLGDAPAKKLK